MWILQKFGTGTQASDKKATRSREPSLSRCNGSRLGTLVLPKRSRLEPQSASFGASRPSAKNLLNKYGVWWKWEPDWVTFLTLWCHFRGRFPGRFWDTLWTHFRLQRIAGAPFSHELRLWIDLCSQNNPDWNPEARLLSIFAGPNFGAPVLAGTQPEPSRKSDRVRSQSRWIWQDMCLDQLYIHIYIYIYTYIHTYV